MTLDEAKINQSMRIVEIRSCALKETKIALQEAGLFKGEDICKLCENKARCAIYRVHRCSRISLPSEISRYIEVEENEAVL